MTLQEIYLNELNKYASKFNVTVEELGPTVLKQAQIDSATYYILYLHLGEAVKEVWPDTCSEEMLLRFGALKPGRLPFQPTAGEYTVSYTGGVVNEIIKTGTVFKQNNGDGQYVVDQNTVVEGDTGTFNVRALQAGFDTELKINDLITSTNPLVGIDDQVTVSAIVALPLAGEDIDEYRALVLEEYRREPQGGSIGDYRSWGRDAQGVRRVYPYLPNPYVGIIDVYTEATPEDSEQGQPSGTPTAAILSEVEEVLEFDPDITLSDEQRVRKPLSVEGVNVISVQFADVVVEVDNIGDGSSETKTKIEADIVSYLFEKRPYQGGVDGTTPKDTIRKNDIERIILNYVDTYDDVILKVNNVIVSSYKVGDASQPTKFGEIPYLSALNYV